MFVDERASSFDVVHTILLEQEFDTLGQTGHRFVLCFHHLFEVQLDIAHLNASLLRVVQYLVVQVGVVQEGFGRNAADVQACATQRTSLLDTGCLTPS